MTIRRLLALALCAASVCLLDACGPSTQRVSRAAPLLGTTWVMLVDLSGSTLSARHDYIDALREVLNAVRPGDHLAILSIEQSSIENSRYLYQGEFPCFVFRPGTSPDTDNQLLLEAFKAKEKQRYANEKAQFERSHDLNTLRRRIRTAVTHAILTHKAPATDIFGALQLGGNLLSTTKGPRRLVMLTDGVVEDQQVSFRRHPPTDTVISSLARTQRLEHRLPSLHGARVLVVGARLGGAVGFAQLGHAWCLYINRHAGGSLQSRFFMSRLSDQLFSAWLTSGHDN